MSETAAAAPAAPVTEAPKLDASAQPAEAFKPGEKVYEIKYPDGRVEKRGESWLLERAQKSVGLEKRVADADKYEKAFGNFVSKIQDPSQLIELLNHPDLKYDEGKQESLVKAMLSSKKPKIIEAVKRWIYDNEVGPSLMDPKEREAKEWKDKAEALESDKLKREKELKEQEEAKNVEDIKAAYRNKLGEAYRASGLPTEDWLVRQVMEKARLYVRAGKHPDFANCCKLVQSEFVSQVKSVLGAAPVEKILDLMDGETPQKINKALMAALNKKDTVPAAAGDKPRTPRREKERTPEERKRWIKNMERGIFE